MNRTVESTGLKQRFDIHACSFNSPVRTCLTKQLLLTAMNRPNNSAVLPGQRKAVHGHLNAVQTLFKTAVNRLCDSARIDGILKSICGTYPAVLSRKLLERESNRTSGRYGDDVADVFPRTSAYVSSILERAELLLNVTIMGSKPSSGNPNVGRSFSNIEKLPTAEGKTTFRLYMTIPSSNFTRF